MEPEDQVHGLMLAPGSQGIILKASAYISVFQTESHYVVPVLNLWSSCLYVWDYRYVKAPSHKPLCLLVCAVNGSICISAYDLGLRCFYSWDPEMVAMAAMGSQPTPDSERSKWHLGARECFVVFCRALCLLPSVCPQISSSEEVNLRHGADGLALSLPLCRPPAAEKRPSPGIPL